MMRRVAILLAATTPAASFKLPWSRSAAAPKSGGYQLGDISKAVYETSATVESAAPAERGRFLRKRPRLIL